ncbi:hypothetical protein FRC11_006009 [Ceratobasidium sp. 423]|nr:hypothetical protein FRC11_006009 [Ceratobasidium sp. 423]
MTRFPQPWVLSNAEEETQDKKWVTLKDLHRHRVLEVVVDGQELRIGIIGLISKDTYAKMDVRASSTFKPLDMEEKCMELAAELRVAYMLVCDAVSHGEDIKLGKRVNTYTAARFSELSGHNLEDTPGVDLIFGGHDHDYYLGGGVELESTTGPGVERPAILPNDDELLIIKSGTDFEDLSEVKITVEDRRNGKERKKVVTSVKVIRHRDPGLANQGTGVETPQQCRMTEILNRILDNEVITNLKKPVARLPPEIATSVLVNQDEASRRGEGRFDSDLGLNQILRKFYKETSSDSYPSAPHLSP